MVVSRPCPKALLGYQSVEIFFLIQSATMSSSTVPKYLGLSGKPMGIAISTILTFGFILVGYDQGMHSSMAVRHLSLTPY